jgi:hypothetical protein
LSNSSSLRDVVESKAKQALLALLYRQQGIALQLRSC